MHVYIHTHVQIFMHACLHTYLHANMCAHTCMPGYTQTYIHTNMNLHEQNMHTHLYMSAYIHACDRYVCLQSYVYVCILMYIQTQMSLYAHIHGCMHTYIYINETFSPRNIYNFRVKYLHSFQICMFPELYTYGNMEISYSANVVICTSLIDNCILLFFI